jgi:predicted AAA+ superfamily ATPase
MLFQFIVLILFLYFQTGAKKAYRKFRHFKDTTVDQKCKAITFRCCFCGATSNSFRLLPSEIVEVSEKLPESENSDVNESSMDLSDEVKLATIFYIIPTNMIYSKSVI